MEEIKGDDCHGTEAPIQGGGAGCANPTLDFSTQYKEAVNRATLARAQRVQAEQDRERAKVEAETIIVKAKGEADSAEDVAAYAAARFGTEHVSVTQQPGSMFSARAFRITYQKAGSPDPQLSPTINGRDP
jgi:hypothetical protein